MSANTKIEWATHTFNPWEGCQKVGPGCDSCYAENRNARFAGGTAINWGPSAPRRRTSAANWRKPLAWDAGHATYFAEHGHRQRVFCASLADVFDNAVDTEWRGDLFDLITDTPNLDWLLLTKRIGNAKPMMAPWLDAQGVYGDEQTDMWENVWLGATIVNQEEADRDIPKPLLTPAAKRFLSMEPLLGPVDLTNVAPPTVEGRKWHGVDALTSANRELRGCIDWVIAGGESGPAARPMHPDWARGLRNQCEAAGVPFLFKQWGEWTPGENVKRQRGTVDAAFLVNNEWSIHPLNLATNGGHIDDEPDVYRVGKKAAGRLLDGIQHDGVPA